MMMDNTNIRFLRQVIWPVAVALFVLTGIFLATAVYWLDRQEDEETAKLLLQAHNTRDALLERDAAQLGFLTRRFAQLYEGQTALMRAGDREKLHGIGRALFDELGRDFSITHGYFIGLDRRVVLRMHKPGFFGDEIQRETLRYAEYSGEPVTSVEVGKTAVPTLRHILPWRENGQLLGYIELGREVDSLMHEIRTLLGVDMLSAIYKEHSNAERFAVGKKVFGFIGQWDDHEHLALLSNSLPAVPPGLVNRWQAGETGVFTVRDGDRVWSVAILPLEDIGGRQAVSLALLRDVTASRQASMRALVVGGLIVLGIAAGIFFALRRHTSRIEAHVLEVNSQLLHASEAAQAANVAKSRFLATMSHELRTPMNGILGMAQLLLMPSLSAENQQYYARTIMQSGETLLILLNDVLDLSKIESGKLEIAPGVLEPDDLVHSIRALFAGAAAEKEVDIAAVATSLAGMRYRGDAHRIRQMLTNLTNNALKFTEAGSVRIEARELERNATDALLEFSVSDTGIGIPEDKLPLLFQPFSQTDSSITRQFGGSGLGLSIVKNLAQLMGGEVGVESSPGKGSRFWFSLRAEIIPQDEDTRASARSDAPTIEVSPEVPPHLEGRVLVVEDNPTNRIVVIKMLERLGLSALLAEDGQQAVALIVRGEMPDIVLMDMQMPVMDGIAATREIRRYEAQAGERHVPIIALTANAMQGDRERCLAAGMDDYMPKPIRFDELSRKLQRMLGAAKPRQEVATVAAPSVTQTPSVFSAEMLLANSADDIEIAQAVVDSALGDMQAQLDRLESLLPDGDRADARRAAHTLKGLAAQIGGQVLFERAREAEMVLRAGDALPTEAVKALRSDFVALKAALEGWRRGG